MRGPVHQSETNSTHTQLQLDEKIENLGHASLKADQQLKMPRKKHNCGVSFNGNGDGFLSPLDS